MGFNMPVRLVVDVNPPADQVLGGSVMPTTFSGRPVAWASQVVLSALMAGALTVTPVTSATYLGCGFLKPAVRCSGYPEFNNNASCICDSTITPSRCKGAGWHSTLYAAAGYTPSPTGFEIHTEPRACAWRYMCAVTVQGYDGQPCLVQPGCQFYSGDGTDEFRVFSADMHPNFRAGAACIQP